MKTSLPIKKAKKVKAQTAVQVTPAKITGLSVNWLDIAFGVADAPVFGWRMESDARGAMQKQYRIIVSKNKSLKNPVWDTGFVSSSLSAAIRYEGKALESVTRYYFGVEVKDSDGKLLVSDPTFFETGIIDSALWKGAEWIMANPADAKAKTKHPAMALHKVVKNAKTIRSVKWIVSGLGVFEAYINGRRVSNLDPAGNEIFDDLKPGFTDARKMRQYFTYDVSHLLEKDAGAKNILAAVVTSGWWSDQPNGRIGKENAFLGQMFITYTDGTKAVISTDKSWLGAFTGSIVNAGIFHGVDIDGRISQNWLTAVKPGDGWSKVVVNTEFNGTIEPLQGPSVRYRDDLDFIPESITIVDAENFDDANDDQYGRARVLRTYNAGDEISLAPGELLIADMGQNAAGRERIRVSGKSGTTLTIRHAEILNDGNGLKSRGNDGAEGTPYYRNLRAARATTTYILNGSGDEECRPLFSFYGYRYIAVITTKPVTLSEIATEIVNSIPKGADTASLVTSNELVNRLIKNCHWGHYSNYLSVPTDCPQRDERLGWTADTQVFTTAAAYDAVSYGFLSKFMRDMRHAQGHEGGFPGVAPYAQYGNDRGKVGWSDAAVIVPYVMWKFYGDTTIIKENMSALARYVEFLDVCRGPIPNWGDWLAYERNDIAIQQFICAAYYYWDLSMILEMAEAVDSKELIEGQWPIIDHLKTMKQAARNHFMWHYLKDGLVNEIYRCQSAYLFTLMLDLNPTEETRQETIKALVKNIEDHGNCLQTGFLGTAILMDTLTKVGETELAYKLLLQENEPSWLYSVLQGATTIWERWNSYTKDKGFGDSGMNSFNHYAYGAVFGWMMNTMAGIRPDNDNPGFKHFILAPIPSDSIGSVNGSYRTPYGTIKSAWSYSGKVWNYEATIPANTTATVKLVCPKGKRILINGKVPKQLTLVFDGLVLREKQGETFMLDAIPCAFSVKIK